MSNDTVAGAGVPVTGRQQLLLAFLALAKRYWFTVRSGRAKYFYLGLVLGLTFLGTYAELLTNIWEGKFSQMLMTKDAGLIRPVILLGVGSMLLMTLIGRAVDLFQSIIAIQWRQWMTETFGARWVDSGAYFKPHIRDALDNPDQRISEDINLFTSGIQKLVLSFISAVSTLVTFSALVWIKGGNYSANFLGLHITIYGYMFWFAIIWAILSTAAAQLVGRALRALTIKQQQREADFRSAAITIRDNAEQIALLKGEKAEKAILTRYFGPVVGISYSLAFFNLRFDTFSGINSMIARLLPTFLLLPRYFHGVYDIGTVMQVTSGIASVTLAFQWIVQNYADIQKYAAVVTRVSELDTAIVRAGRHLGPSRTTGTTNHLTAIDLTLTLPDGRTILSGIDLDIAPGSRWFLRGPSGVGKSTLMRALSGIWQFGRGSVVVPRDPSALHMMPQRLYVPRGTLKAALCYPEMEESFSDAACADALRRCNLEAFVSRLHEEQAWQDTMSPGQQQRLGFARILLHRPAVILLDESTSALDEDNERQMYDALTAALPDSTIVSVSHRPAVGAYHAHEYAVGRDA